MRGSDIRVLALLFLALLPIEGVRAQGQYVGPSILPAPPEAIDGGNPFQGLGRSDDPGVSRERQYGFPSYNNSGFNANNMHDFPAPGFISDSWAAYPHNGDSPSTNSRVGNTAGISTGATQTGGFTGTNGPVTSQASYIPTSALDTPSNSTQTGVIPGAYSAQPAAAGNFNSGGAQQNGINPANPQFAPGFAGQAGYGSGPSGSAAGIDSGNSSLNNNNNNNNNTGIGGGGAVSSVGPAASITPGVIGAPGFGAPSAGSTGASKSSNLRSNTSTQGLPSSTQGFPNPDHRERPDLDKFGTPSDILTPLTNNGTFDSGSEAGSSSFAPNSDTPLEAPIVTSRDSLSFSENMDHSSKQIKSPLSGPLDKMKAGRLQEALKEINLILQSDSGNANAHYVKAVICVLTRNFDDAKKEYEQTIKLTHNEQLIDRAKTGLTKLGTTRVNH